MGKREKAKNLSPAVVFPPWSFGESSLLLSLKDATSLCEQIQTIHDAIVQCQKDDQASMWIWLLQWMLQPSTPQAIRRTISAKWSKRKNHDDPETRRRIEESVYESVRLQTTGYSQQKLDVLWEFSTWWTKQKDKRLSLQKVLDEISSIFLSVTNSLSEDDIGRRHDIVRLATMTAQVILSGDSVKVENDVIDGFWEILSTSDVSTKASTTLALCYAKLNPRFVSELGTVENLYLRMSLVAAYSVTARADDLAVIQSLCFEVASSASDPDVRVLAWKGLRSLMERSDIHSWDKTLQFILSAWEHPPTRAIALAIPPVFNLFQKRHPDPRLLITPILQQPLRSKGRYVALQYLVDYMSKEQKNALTKELVMYLGDFSHTIVAVADLYGSLMVVGEFEADLAQQLTAPSALSRRRQILAYCLPKIMACDKPETSLRTLLQFIFDMPADGRTIERETPGDRIAWCLLEVVRYAEKVILGHQELQEFVQSMLQKEISSLLLHFSEHVRLSAFQCLRIVFYHPRDPWMSISLEEAQWRQRLLWSAKTENKEFTTSLFLTLALFLDRMAQQESRIFPDRSSYLPSFTSFVVNFLLGTMVECLGYPGTVVTKEGFLLELLECVFVFSCREHVLARRSKLIPNSGAVHLRKRSTSEECSMMEIRKALLGKEVFASLFVLLRSSWDPIRTSAFSFATHLVGLADTKMSLPVEFEDISSMSSAVEYATTLASSPQPRKADSGACMLAFFFRCSKSKGLFLLRLTNLLDSRLENLDHFLSEALQKDSLPRLNGEELPMVHGIILAWKLIIDDPTFPAYFASAESSLAPLFRQLLGLLHKALALSLAVVADINDGEDLDCFDDMGFVPTRIERDVIDPRTIGSNGIFSSLKSISKDDAAWRYASQRVVIGTWLLTKEACGALSSLLNVERFAPQASLFSHSGLLLLNTLTAIKHAGAAFAAHRALQQIAIVCFNLRSVVELNSPTTNLPRVWIDWIFNEVTGSERIRDSTCRRSSGYSLGLLSLMRAEMSSSCSIGGKLTPEVLHSLLCYSLPSKADMVMLETQLERKIACFIFATMKNDIVFIDQRQHSVRTRVHALNALRLAILDAPLSNEVLPLLGASIMSAIMGYFDNEWSIRNSSTLLFSAALQRSIDRDKNGSGTDATSKTATTATELFQRFPSLRDFLLTAFDGTVSSPDPVLITRNMPAALPVMTILARLQAIRYSSSEALSLIEPFVPLLLQRLSDQNYTTRFAAAKALNNICADVALYAASAKQLFAFCRTSLKYIGKGEVLSWNLVHGCLLLVDQLITSHSYREFVGGIIDSLAALVSVSDAIPLAPLPCIALALQCLSCILNHCDLFMSRCSSIMRWLEDTPATTRNRLAGYGELGAVLGRVLTTMICQTLWTQSKYNHPNKSIPVSCLIAMISSCNFDIKVASVKVLKKSLRKPIPVTTASEPFRISLIKQVSYLILQELSISVHQHPPTLRRLSQCLIELLNDDRVLHTEAGDLALSASSALTKAMWNDRFAVPSEMHGTSIELLGHFLCHGKVQELDQFWFLSCLDRLLDPSNDFRLRYSASVVTHKLLQNFSILDCELMSTLLSIWIRATQDGNVDVRFAAGALASESQITSRSFVPEISLYRGLTEGVGKHYLLPIILHHADAEGYLGVQERPSFDKIFAEERLNSYEEPSILAELFLLAVTLDRIPSSEHFKECSVSFTDHLRSIVRDTITESVIGMPINNLLSFLFRDPNQSCRLFILATALLSYDVSLPLLMDEFSRKWHPALNKALTSASGFFVDNEDSPGHHVLLTTRL